MSFPRLRLLMNCDGAILTSTCSGSGVVTASSASAPRSAGIPFRAIQTGKLRRYLGATDCHRRGQTSHRHRPGMANPAVLPARCGVFDRRIRQCTDSCGGSRIAPILTHEQTAAVGLANRINARFADVFAVSHDQTAAAAGAVHRRVVVTGNPVRCHAWRAAMPLAGVRIAGLRRIFRSC